jgi:DNA polymerase-3 subunit epsilon
VAERLAVALLGPDPRVRRLSDGRWGIVAQASGSPLIEDAAFAVVDVETTGTRPGGSDRVTEMAVVIVQGSRCETVFESLVNPERPIPAMVTAVTRISDGMVRVAPVFDELADQLVAALAGRILVAHNLRFDWRFLTTELKRSRALGLDGQRLCTVRLARQLVPGLASYGLDALAMYFNLTNPARHRAGGDALTTGRLLQRLLDLARGAGARTIADLERMQVKRRKKRRGRRRRSAPESM